MGFLRRILGLEEKIPKETKKLFDLMKGKIFPDDNKQIRRETKDLMEVLGRKFDYNKTENLLLKTKALYFLTEDRSQERMIEFIMKEYKNEISENDAILVYRFIVSRFLDLIRRN